MADILSKSYAASAFTGTWLSGDLWTDHLKMAGCGLIHIYEVALLTEEIPLVSVPSIPALHSEPLAFCLRTLAETILKFL